LFKHTIIQTIHFVKTETTKKIMTT